VFNLIHPLIEFKVNTKKLIIQTLYHQATSAKSINKRKALKGIHIHLKLSLKVLLSDLHTLLNVVIPSLIQKRLRKKPHSSLFVILRRNEPVYGNSSYKKTKSCIFSILLTCLAVCMQFSSVNISRGKYDTNKLTRISIQ
jgi:hypothetical protein